MCPRYFQTFGWMKPACWAQSWTSSSHSGHVSLGTALAAPQERCCLLTSSGRVFKAALTWCYEPPPPLPGPLSAVRSSPGVRAGLFYLGPWLHLWAAHAPRHFLFWIQRRATEMCPAPQWPNWRTTPAVTELTRLFISSVFHKTHLRYTFLPFESKRSVKCNLFPNAPWQRHRYAIKDSS